MLQPSQLIRRRDHLLGAAVCSLTCERMWCHADLSVLRKQITELICKTNQREEPLSRSTASIRSTSPDTQHNLSSVMRRAGEHFVREPCVLKRKDRAYSWRDSAVLEHLIEKLEAGGCHVGIEEHRINIFAIRQGLLRHHRDQLATLFQRSYRLLQSFAPDEVENGIDLRKLAHKVRPIRLRNDICTQLAQKIIIFLPRNRNDGDTRGAGGQRWSSLPRQPSFSTIWTNSRLLVDVTPAEPLYRSLMELRPSNATRSQGAYYS